MEQIPTSYVWVHCCIRDLIRGLDKTVTVNTLPRSQAQPITGGNIGARVDSVSGSGVASPTLFGGRHGKTHTGKQPVVTDTEPVRPVITGCVPDYESQVGSAGRLCRLGMWW